MKCLQPNDIVAAAERTIPPKTGYTITRKKAKILSANFELKVNLKNHKSSRNPKK